MLLLEKTFFIEFDIYSKNKKTKTKKKEKETCVLQRNQEKISFHQFSFDSIFFPFAQRKAEYKKGKKGIKHTYAFN